MTRAGNTLLPGSGKNNRRQRLHASGILIFGAFGNRLTVVEQLGENGDGEFSGGKIDLGGEVPLGQLDFSILGCR